jgi:hypothetical protein
MMSLTMNSLNPGRILAAVLFLAAPALLAQWQAWPTPGVPRTPDGKPNLAAPTPKAADGHPDLSGVWEYVRPPGAPTPGSAAAQAARRGSPAENARPGEILPRAVLVSQFWNLGASFPGGLPFQPWADELHRKRVADNSKDNPDAHCLPMGLMQFNTHGQPRKIIQTPDVVVIMYEANAGIRQIFTDGRALPKDPQPWWYGYSVGRWDGDTLVVETTGFRELGWLDVEGSPLTESGKIIERFRRPDAGHLELEATIDDPKAYTKPWTFKFYYRLMADAELIEMVCQENEVDAPHLQGK